MPLPTAGISLGDKLTVTQALSASGADIHELNTVRKQLSGVKGGRLRAACRAQRMITLTISDVLGDPLDVIASGPTEINTTTASDALQILKHRISNRSQIPIAVWNYLEHRVDDSSEVLSESGPSEYYHAIIGNNATAVDAACEQAREMGYCVKRVPTVLREPSAEEVAAGLIHEVEELIRLDGKWCVISGGEPTVALVSRERRGLGGRNQQLVLAALQNWRNTHSQSTDLALPWTLIAGGTDGEDGPTDAAGAILSDEVIRRADALHLAPEEFLERNDAYHFFEQCGGLLKTGPTHTNVCDLRVVTSISDRDESRLAPE
jgi:glycerate-2-kinase